MTDGTGPDLHVRSPGIDRNHVASTDLMARMRMADPDRGADRMRMGANASPAIRGNLRNDGAGVSLRALRPGGSDVALIPLRPRGAEGAAISGQAGQADGALRSDVALR